MITAIAPREISVSGREAIARVNPSKRTVFARIIEPLLHTLVRLAEQGVSCSAIAEALDGAQLLLPPLHQVAESLRV